MSHKIELADYQVDILDRLEDLKSKFSIGDEQTVILVDENSRAYCLPKLLNVVPELKQALVLEIPSGEAYKSFNTCERLWTSLMEQGISRNGLWVNLGGGIIGDLGGLAASLYKRGIPFVNIPTTLLAQVDATVGGKVAVNFNGVKNNIGLFSNPKAVFISSEFLKSLDHEQVLNGMAEILKHGLISDRSLWDDCQQVNEVEQVDWNKLIHKSLLAKKTVVEEDPFEKGWRKVLNFGHTLGHAFESHAIKHDIHLLHGQAVALGMVGEAFLSVKKCGLPDSDRNNITKSLSAIYSDYWNLDLLTEEALKWVYHDKKNVSENFNFTLLKSIGNPAIDVSCTMDDCKEALVYLKGVL